MGYPFSHLVPSLGTVLGASGDRPDALADLMGIILNDGLKLPTGSIDQLRGRGKARRTRQRLFTTPRRCE